MWKEMPTEHPTLKIAESYRLDFSQDSYIDVFRLEGDSNFSALAQVAFYGLLESPTTDANVARLQAVIDTLKKLPTALADLHAAISPMPVKPLAKPAEPTLEPMEAVALKAPTDNEQF